MKKAVLLLSFVLAACAAPLNANESSEPKTINPEAFRPFSLTIISEEPSPQPIRIEEPIIDKPIVRQMVHRVSTYSNPKRAAKKFARSKVGSKQFSCLEPLWKHESGWNHRNLNESSGAYGIPQALPGKKMRSIDSDWKTNPITQVKWGVRYVNQRYGSACKAWKFWQSHNWY
jgi:hypothetical protein